MAFLHFEWLYDDWSLNTFLIIDQNEKTDDQMMLQGYMSTENLAKNKGFEYCQKWIHPFYFIISVMITDLWKSLYKNIVKAHAWGF